MDADKKHILVADDDNRLRALLQKFLRENGFLVSAAASAQEARAFLADYQFDLIVLDIMMPGESGLEFLSGLRTCGGSQAQVPVVLLTAMGETFDRINGLETGADDYLAKPFEPRELILRIGNILRRAGGREKKPAVVALGGCSFDLAKKELIGADGARIRLTPTEQSLLSILAAEPGRFFTRDELAELLHSGQEPRSIDVQITRLRKKIEADSRNPRYVQTVRGKGYSLLSD